MKPIYKYLIVAAVSAILALLIRSWLVKPVPPEVIEKKVVVRVETSKYVSPEPIVSVKLPNYKFIAFPTDTLQQLIYITETDSVMVPIPITQKVYQDTSYTAYVSGFEPSLDSIFVYNKVIETTSYVYPKKHSLSPLVGVEFTPSFIQAKAGVILKTPIANRFDLYLSGGYSMLYKGEISHSPFLEATVAVNIFNW